MSTTSTGPASTSPTSTTLLVTTTSPLVVTPTTIRVPLLPEDDPMAGPHTIVSWYGSESGAHTANGDAYDPAGLTFAHKTMRFGTQVRFCGPLGCVVARATDRGPFVAGREFDLSRAAFAAIAPLSAGVVEVSWEVVA